MLRWARRLSIAQELEKIAFRNKNIEAIHLHQLNKFNSTWNYAINNFTFYRDMQIEYKLPASFRSLAEIGTIPTVSKEQLIPYRILS